MASSHDLYIYLKVSLYIIYPDNDKKNISKVLKLLFSISIIYILIQFNIINVNDIALLTKNYTLVLYSLIIFFIVIILASLKWWILLVSANYNIPFLMTYFLYSTGLFFNNFMPGGTGGDIMGVYLYRFVAKSQRTDFYYYYR